MSMWPLVSKATYCPVCNGYLGQRVLAEVFSVHCEECKTTYTWHPKTAKPTALLDGKKKSKGCGCGNCKG